MLVTVVIWSLNFSAVKSAFPAFQPLSFTLVRFAVGVSLTLVIVLARQGVPRFARRDLPLLVTAAFFGITVNQVMLVYALHETTAANTSLLAGTLPIWTAITAIGLRQERLTLRHWGAIIAGMAGVAMIVFGQTGGSGGGTLLGDLLALGVAATWAVYSVLIRPLMARYSALQLSAFMMTVGSLMLVPFGIPDLARQDWSLIGAQQWLALLYAAVLSVTLTNILYFSAIARVGPSRASLYTYLEPFLGAMFAMVLLREQVTIVQLLGGVVVIGAIVFARQRGAPIAEPGM